MKSSKPTTAESTIGGGRRSPEASSTAENGSALSGKLGQPGRLSSGRSAPPAGPSNTVVIVHLPSVGGITPPVRVAGRI